MTKGKVKSSILAKEYDYELGISFLSKDEALASKLNTELKKYVPTYFYPEHQKEQAFQNSANVYATIFGSKIRFVIILYRDGWGDAGITSVEQGAIQQNILIDKDRGVNYIFLVKMDGTQPIWYKSQTYVKYENTKFELLVELILYEYRQIGGTVNKLTPQQKLAEQKRIDDFRLQRDNFLNATDGVALKLGITEYRNFEYIFIKSMEEHCKTFPLKTGRTPLHDNSPNNKSWIFFCTEDYCIVISWKTKYTRYLQGDELHVYAGKQFDGFKTDFKRIATASYSFTLDEDNTPGWALLIEPDSFFTSQQVFDNVYEKFVAVTQEFQNANYLKRHAQRS